MDEQTPVVPAPDLARVLLADCAAATVLLAGLAPIPLSLPAPQAL